MYPSLICALLLPPSVCVGSWRNDRPLNKCLAEEYVVIRPSYCYKILLSKLYSSSDKEANWLVAVEQLN